MSKTAIVTGASRGIGYEIVRSLAAKGLSVAALARSEAPLARLQEEFPDQVLIWPLDLADESAVRRFAGEFHGRLGQADILINNAGSLVNKPFEELEAEDWHRMLNANLISAVQLTRALFPYFGAETHIVNISSMGGFQGSAKFKGLSAYSVAKGALSILSECLATEWAEHGIRVNALCLGAVQTEMFTQAFPEFTAPVSPKEMGAYVADFALHASRFYNGRVLPVSLADPG